MTIIAELHNGTKIHFPDGTPDHEIDATVGRHVAALTQPAVQPQQPMMGGMSIDPSAVQALMQAVAAHSQAMMAGRNQEMTDRQQAEDERNAQGAETAKAHVQHVGNVAAHLNNGFGAVVPVLAEIADNTAHGKEIATALNNVSTAIMEVGKAMIAAMHAPKEIYRDEKGAPKGIAVKGKK